MPLYRLFAGGQWDGMVALGSHVFTRSLARLGYIYARVLFVICLAQSYFAQPLITDGTALSDSDTKLTTKPFSHNGSTCSSYS